jgi:hypothetical protein
MYDVKAIQMLDAARVRTVDYLPPDEVRSIFLVALGQRLPVVLDVTGDNFNRAQKVLLNGASLQFRVLSGTRMLVTVPDTMAGRQITSLFVLTDATSFMSTSLYSYALGSKVEFFQGYQKLVAQFLKLLMTTPGSGVFARNSGGGLQKFPGSVQKSPHQSLTAVSQAIFNTAEQLIASQSGVDMPPAEKLRNVEIARIDFAKGDPTSVEVGLRIKTQTGGAFPVNLQLGAKSVVDQLLKG